MREEQFIKTYSDTWKALEEFSVIIGRKGVRSLPSKEVKRFLHIFRLSSHHLAYARTHYPNSSLVGYLNALVGKCHSHVYAVRKVSPASFVRYAAYGFPLLLKTYRQYILGSFGFFAFGALVASGLVLLDPSNAGLFLPGYIAENVKGGTAGGGDWNYPLMSGYIMVNNISVALRAFVLGITLGLGTVYVLFTNGALLGALTALIYLYGNPVSYWALILPHGVIELTAIFISGAAGLLIAKNILLPGEYSRAHALIAGAKKAVSLLIGVVLMLVIAGIIEGFFTPLSISEGLKLGFAAVTAAGLVIYFSVPYVVKKPSTSSTNIASYESKRYR